MRGYNIYITVPDGDPSGLKILTKSSWTGRIFFFPRAKLYDVIARYPELEGVGVYFLVILYETPPGVYIGEADGLKDRLIAHDQEQDMDFSHVIVFTEGCKDAGGTSFLHKAIVQYLESRLITSARYAKKANVINENRPTLPTLSERERIEASNIWDELMQVLPLTGLDIFYLERNEKAEEGSVEFILEKTRKRKHKNLQVRATMRPIDSKYLVLRGSQAFAEETESCPPNYKNLRKKLIQLEVLQPDPDNQDLLKFVQDYEFQSPSQAAAVIYGGSINGRKEWKGMVYGEQLTLEEFEKKKSAIQQVIDGGTF